MVFITINMVKYYKGKCYFEERVHGQTIRARTACVILRYRDLTGKVIVLTIKESLTKDVLEFPGGKVEPTDNNIYDTLLRESWEEIVLKDEFEKHSLQNWRQVHDVIMEENNDDAKFFNWLKNQLPDAQVVTYGNCSLRTVYYIVDITFNQADHLIKNHGMIPFAVVYMNNVVDYNKKTKSKEKRFARRTTYFHIGDKTYRLRGRDFEGMFKFAAILENFTKKRIQWRICGSPAIVSTTQTVALVQ